MWLRFAPGVSSDWTPAGPPRPPLSRVALAELSLSHAPPPSPGHPEGVVVGLSSFLGLPRPAPPRSEPGEGSRGAELVVVVAPVCGALGARLGWRWLGLEGPCACPACVVSPSLPLPSSEGRPGNEGTEGRWWAPGSHPSPVACACPAACGATLACAPRVGRSCEVDVQGVVRAPARAVVWRCPVWPSPSLLGSVPTVGGCG